MMTILFLMRFALLPAHAAEEVTGILFGKQDITLKSKTQGEVTEIRRQEGDVVIENDVLAVIDDQQEKIERELAKSDYELARSDLERTKKLHKYVSKDEIDQKSAALAAKKSQFDLKEYALNNTRVTSPIAGVVARKYLERGETVAVGDKAYDVVQLEELVLKISLPAALVSKVSVGSELGFRSDIHRDRMFMARITQISPVIDAASNTIRVQLIANNPHRPDGSYELKPGMVVTLAPIAEPFGAGGYGPQPGAAAPAPTPTVTGKSLP